MATIPSTLTHSPFAYAQTLDELEERWEVFTSPENLYADGERSYNEARALLARYQRDFQTRRSELVGAR